MYSRNTPVQYSSPEFPVGFSGSSYFDGRSLVNNLSSRETHWITPSGPTALDALLRLPLPGLDHVFNPIDALMIYPGPIDVDRLKAAIATTLNTYPHASGRLQRDTRGRWHIKLSKSPVPLTVTSSTSTVNETIMASSYPKDLVDPLPWTSFPLEDKRMAEEPLIRFKLVKLLMTGETSFSVHASHVLGDASSIFMLLKTVSDLYERPGHRPSIPSPSYEKYLSSPPSPPPPASRSYQDAASRIPNFFKSFTKMEYEQIQGETMRSTDRVDFRISGRQLQTLQRTANSQADSKVSQGDALIALFWKTINEVYPKEEQCNRLMNIVQYRARITDEDDIFFDFPSKSSVGNVRLPLVSPQVPESNLRSLGSLALTVRRLITETSSPDHITACITLAESLSLSTALKGKISSFSPQKGCIGASLMHKGGFHEIHFGYRDQVKFWPLNEPIERYVRVVPANPEWSRLNGVRVVGDEGAVVVSLRVRRDVKERFITSVEGSLKELDDVEVKQLDRRDQHVHQML